MNMRTAYFDCASGISGDMTLGALIDAGVAVEALQAAIDSLRLPSCKLAVHQVKKHGFRAAHVVVEHEPEHAHRHLSDITKMIDGSVLSDRQKQLATAIFTRLGEAEARVHGTTIEKVHFHEVGAVDSIADIVGAAVGFDLLGVERVECSPIPMGRGQIKIAHGVVSVPAPATAELLRGIPIASCEVDAELTTPTGAAIAAELVDGFGPLPAMKIDVIGYGAGTSDLPDRPNMLRLLVGEAVESLQPGTAGSGAARDTVWMLETNLDDCTGETIGYCTERLLGAGALDVFTTAIQMKKNRPGVVLSVLAEADQISQLEHLLFRETTTLGVRKWPLQRHVLRRKPHTVKTVLGDVLGKVSWSDEIAVRFSPECDACRQIAETHGVSLAETMAAAQASFDPADVNLDC